VVVAGTTGRRVDRVEAWDAGAGRVCHAVNVGFVFDDLPDWEFTVNEFSPSGYRLVAIRNGGIRGEATGTDPDVLMEDYKAWARYVDQDLAERAPSGTADQSAERQSAQKSSGWKFLDALVLASVGDGASVGVGLSRVIGLVDYVDRVVLRHGEAERTLQRLVGSGLVEQVDGMLRRTVSGQSLHDSCPPTAMWVQLRCIEQQLIARIPCTPSSDWSLSADEFASAVLTYRDEMRRTTDGG
jgi:hypothetical protein